MLRASQVCRNINGSIITGVSLKDSSSIKQLKQVQISKLVSVLIKIMSSSSRPRRGGGGGNRHSGSIIKARMGQQNKRTQRSGVSVDGSMAMKAYHLSLSDGQQELNPAGAESREARTTDVNEGESSAGNSRSFGRPPPHLKGREIGLWYASRSRQKTKSKSGPSAKTKVDNFINADKYAKLEVTLNSERQSKIQGLLSKLESLKNEGAGALSSITSKFHQEYAQNIRDNNFAAPPSSTSTSSSLVNPGPNYSGLLFDVNSVLQTDQASGTRRSAPIPIEASRDAKLDQLLIDEVYAKERDNSQYRQMMEFRQALPAYKAVNDIVELVLNNQIIVLEGETGCGKTTQVPQYILDRWILDGNGSICNIVCTQPRRISAVSVAERVAQERGEIVGGKSVGYSIRLESRLPKGRTGGTLIFCTTGVLFQHLKSDPYLNHVSHLIVDEIHERDVLSDFLLAIVKDLMIARPDLKVILMSATINAQQFSAYFDNCPIFHIDGFTFPVEEFYLEDALEKTKFHFQIENRQHKWSHKKKITEDMRNFELFIRPYIRKLEKTKQYSSSTLKELALVESESINLDLIQAVIEHIVFCEEDKNGSILVFLPGWDNISKLHQQLANCPQFSTNYYLIIPLHSLMPTINQREVFCRPPPGKRKIVISTNIAETSITIEDVVFVIDCGKIKMTNFDVENNIETLGTEWVSRANATQRKGRAGRTQAGKCYHLYSRAREETFEDYKKPEVLRKGLQEEILRIKILKMGKAMPFFNRLMDPPSPQSTELAMKRLHQLHALDENENLTPLGFHLSQLPMDPQSGRMILLGAIFSCCDPILSVAASLSFKDPFYVPLGKEKIVDRIRKDFSGVSKSDHIALVNAIQGYEFSKISNSHKDFCYKHFISPNTLKLLEDLKGQFAQYLKDLGFLKTLNYKDPSININSRNVALLKAIICSGLYPNVAKVKLKRRGMIHFPVAFTEDDGRVEIHPKSVNSQETSFESPFLVYHHKMKTSSIFLHDTTMVAPFPLIFFGGELDFLQRKGYGSVGVDGSIRFLCNSKVYGIIDKLRKELDNLLEYKIQHPGPTSWNELSREGALLQAINELITTEYKALMDDKFDYDDDDDSDDEYLLPNPDL